MLIILNLNFGDFHVSTNTLVQNFYYLSDFYPCSIATKLLWNHTYGVVKRAKQSLPLQFGSTCFQYISLN